MSVLHSLISSRAMALGALAQDTPVWPASAVFFEHDIAVSQQSLSGLAAERGTPCVLIAPSDGHPGAEAYRTVIITRVLACTARSGHRHPMELTVDCDLSALDARVLDAALVQTPHRRHRAASLMHSADGQTTISTNLPQHTAPGALVALTCTGTVALAQVLPHRLSAPVHHEAELSADTAEDGDEDDAWVGRCRKE